MRRDEGVSSSDKNGRSEVRALHVVRLFGDNLRCQALLELYHLAADVTTSRDRNPLEKKQQRQQGLGGSPQIQEGYFVIEFLISMICRGLSEYWDILM